jgi:hypothetical protein
MAWPRSVRLSCATGRAFLNTPFHSNTDRSAADICENHRNVSQDLKNRPLGLGTG